MGAPRGTRCHDPVRAHRGLRMGIRRSARRRQEQLRPVAATSPRDTLDHQLDRRRRREPSLSPVRARDIRGELPGLRPRCLELPPVQRAAPRRRVGAGLSRGEAVGALCHGGRPGRAPVRGAPGTRGGRRCGVRTQGRACGALHTHDGTGPPTRHDPRRTVRGTPRGGLCLRHAVEGGRGSGPGARGRSRLASRVGPPPARNSTRRRPVRRVRAEPTWPCGPASWGDSAWRTRRLWTTR